MRYTGLVLFALFLFPTAIAHAAPVSSCPTITVRLSNGVSHTQVITLKKFLVSEGVMGTNSYTTYFGPLTQSALQKWQCKKGIVCSGSALSSGYGSTGPRTRLALKDCAVSEGTKPAATTTIVTTKPVSPQSAPTPPPSSGSTGGSSAGGTAPPAFSSCTLNNQTIAPNASVTAYQASTVPAGQQCISETRMCINGTLSGSYANANCAVEPVLQLCVNCIRVRLGNPVVLRQSNSSQFDSPFSAFKLADGSWRGITTGWKMFDGTNKADTSAITASTISGFWGSNESAILSHGSSMSSFNGCGAWMYNPVRLDSRTLVAVVHNERRNNNTDGPTGGPTCDVKQPYQTYGTASIAISDDEGAHWIDKGPILTNAEVDTKDKARGLNNCDTIDGHDGFLYAYCTLFNENDHGSTVVARAPFTATGVLPGGWKQWSGSDWNISGLGGVGAKIGNYAEVASYWIDSSAVVGFFGAGAQQISFSTNKTQFQVLPEPFLPIESASNFNPDGSSDTERIGFMSLINDQAGGNSVHEHSYLTYTFTPKDSNDRYLVIQDLWLTKKNDPIVGPQVGVALSNWFYGNENRTTSGVVINNTGAWSLSERLGFVMTKAPAVPSQKIEECVSNAGTDYILSVDGTCAPAGYKRLRTSGWVFKDQQPNTVPLFECTTGVNHFAATNRDCKGKGTAEGFLGYIMNDSY